MQDQAAERLEASGRLEPVAVLQCGLGGLGPPGGLDAHSGPCLVDGVKRRAPEHCHLLGGKGSCQQIALASVAPERRQLAELAGCLYPFADDRHPKGVGHGCDGSNDLAGRGRCHRSARRSCGRSSRCPRSGAVHGRASSSRSRSRRARSARRASTGPPKSSSPRQARRSGRFR